MHIAILTLFPEALEPYLRTSILGIAQQKGAARIELIDFRDFTRDRHRTVDDRPFGGGPGMVLKPEPIFDCVEWWEARHGPARRVLLSPAGRPFAQAMAREFALDSRLLLLCGRYEGIDERVAEELSFQEVSIGDFVLAGGELPALAIAEAVARLLPGVLGDERSAEEESFGTDGLLDTPHFTRPRRWRGREVPPVLLSGDHAAIARWRARESERRTQTRRPDLHKPSPRPPQAEKSSLPAPPAPPTGPCQGLP